MAQRLRRVDHQVEIQVSAYIGQRRHGLCDAAVAGQCRQVHQRGTVGRQRAGRGVDVESAVTVGGQRTHVEIRWRP